MLKLCAACGVWMLMRTPLLPLTKLGDLLHHVFPDIPTSDSYGKVRRCAICGCVCMAACDTAVTLTRPPCLLLTAC